MLKSFLLFASVIVQPESDGGSLHKTQKAWRALYTPLLKRLQSSCPFLVRSADQLKKQFKVRNHPAKQKSKPLLVFVSLKMS